MINLGDSHRVMLGVWRLWGDLEELPLRTPPFSTLLITDNWAVIGVPATGSYLLHPNDS
jgi:hypothetical protein